MSRCDDYDNFCYNLCYDLEYTIDDVRINNNQQSINKINIHIDRANNGYVDSLNWITLMNLKSGKYDEALHYAARAVFGDKAKGWSSYMTDDECAFHAMLMNELLILSFLFNGRDSDAYKLLCELKQQKGFLKFDVLWDYWLGFLFHEGKGVQQNYAEAYKYYLSSATSGNYEACFKLAVCYKNGEGVVPDNNLAYEWATKANSKRLSWWDEMLSGSLDKCGTLMLLAIFECDKSNIDKSRNLLLEITNYNNSLKVTAQKYLDTINSNNNSNSAGGGCYIATCVYGSYDCPKVWTLRRFRDFTLDESIFGRLFIKLYYRISPTIVAKYGENKKFRAFWRFILDIMVKQLKNKGVSDTPYKDKY